MGRGIYCQQDVDTFNTIFIFCQVTLASAKGMVIWEGAK